MSPSTFIQVFSLIGLLAAIILILKFFKAFWMDQDEIKQKQQQRANETQQLKHQYEHALSNGDKAEALRLGRMYYARLRGGELTIYDEQAIANDMATMK